MKTLRLFVTNLEASETFYQNLLATRCSQASDRHRVFETNAFCLELRYLPQALWVARNLDIALSDEATVISTYENLWDACARLPQIPQDMGIGTGFLAIDPDGHRLRVYSPRQTEAA